MLCTCAATDLMHLFRQHAGFRPCSSALIVRMCRSCGCRAIHACHEVPGTCRFSRTSSSQAAKQPPAPAATAARGSTHAVPATAAPAPPAPAPTRRLCSSATSASRTWRQALPPAQRAWHHSAAWLAQCLSQPGLHVLKLVPALRWLMCTLLAAPESQAADLGPNPRFMCILPWSNPIGQGNPEDCFALVACTAPATLCLKLPTSNVLIPCPGPFPVPPPL